MNNVQYIKTKIYKFHIIEIIPQRETVSIILTGPNLTQCFKSRFTFICILSFWWIKYSIYGWYYSSYAWTKEKSIECNHKFFEIEREERKKKKE